VDEFPLLAKPDMPLLTHLKEVTEEGKVLAKRLGLSSELVKRAVLACAFHDVGKSTDSFQDYIRGKRGKAYPHALASLPFVLVAELCAFGMPPIGTAAVVSHHSPLRAEVYEGYGVPDYHRDTLVFLKSLREYLKECQLEEVLKFFENCLFYYRRGESPSSLLKESLRFGSTKKTLRGVFKELSVRSFADVKTVLQIADWLASSGKRADDAVFLRHGKECISQYIKRNVINLRDFQRKAGENQEKRLWLRAPTGTGKTEALLLWAGDSDRILYFLPTQATANAMWRRLRKIYGEDKVGLAHGKAGYILRKEKAKEDAEEDSLDLRLFASVFAKPVVVGTLDQYLLAHLHGRHWEERRSLARRATVLIDEIHSYDPYTLGLLVEALSEEPPARLALASATLPEVLMKFLGPEPVLEAEASLWKRQRHRLCLHSEAISDRLEAIVFSAREGKRVLVIANTVRRAQEIYRVLRERTGERVQILHSRFTFKDRQKKEEQLQNAEQGVILVATQIVEVSLDISYDVLFTEVAPIDALVQRMGRVNRRGDCPPAPVHIFKQFDKGTEKIYGKEVLARSWELLRELPELPNERDWVTVTNHLYEELVSAPSYQEHMRQGRRTLREVKKILGCHTIDLSDEEMRSRFTTRRGQFSIEVLPTRFKNDAFQFKDAKEGWHIVELLVPVPIYWPVAFHQWFTPCPDLGCFITELPYSEDIGLSMPQENAAPSGMEMW